MIKTFKKYFIPHKHNKHRPHILRWEAALVILSLTLLVEVYFLVQAFWLMPSINFFAAIIPNAIVDITNQERLTNNLNFLKTNALLTQAAQLKAEDMAQKGYFAHTSPQGLTPWFWLGKTGYQFNFAGENLAINFLDSQDVTNAWMNSPSHRANILNNNFTEIGVGTAKGEYQGQETTFIVQFFGRPTQVLAQVSTPTKPVEIASVPSSPAPPASAPTQSPSQLFVAVKGANETSNPPQPANSNEFSSQNQPSQSGFLNNFLATPHAISNYFYFVLLTILGLALLLKIFIKIKIQHPTLIVNGVALIIIIASIVWVNQYIALAQARII